MEIKIISCVFLLAYLIIAVIDGLYFHIYKYKLYARLESRREHLLHTLNAVLFPWSLYFIFFDRFKGIYLYFGVLLLIISLIVEYVDLYEEKKSRSQLGGLSCNEYAMHFSLSCLRGVYTTLILLSKSRSDWYILNSKFSETNTELSFINFFIYPVIIVGIIISIFHILLLFYKTENAKEITNL